MIETIYTAEDLLQFHTECSERGRELMRRKNHDYSGVADVFRNFRAFEGLGIIVRASDKLARLRSFEEKGDKLLVNDETLTDTAIDLMNYAILYLAYKRNRAGSPVQMSDTDMITYLRARHPFTCGIFTNSCYCTCGERRKP